MILSAIAAKLKRRSNPGPRGEWRYLYRAIDKHGISVDFLLTANRDLEAAQRFFRKLLEEQPLLAPDRIGTDAAGPYPPAIATSRKAGLLARTPVHRVTKHLQRGIESDHFRGKKNMPRIGSFRSFATARAADHPGLRGHAVATGLRLCRRLDRVRAEPTAGSLFRTPGG